MESAPRVAIIDDDRVWLETLAEYLCGKAYSVETALGGTRGLHLLERGEFHLAVIDYHMPDLDGMQLLRQLRLRRLNVDVLLLSSDDDPTLPPLVLREGAAAFLSKNAAPGLLLRSLTQTLSAVFAEMALRPAARSRWDRFLPVLRRPQGRG